MILYIMATIAIIGILLYAGGFISDHILNKNNRLNKWLDSMPINHKEE